MRFGLNGKIAMPLSDIAEVYNLTKERIRQIEQKALKTLREFARLLPAEGAENVHYQIDVLRRLVELGRLAQLEMALTKRCPKPSAPWQCTVEDVRREVVDLYEQFHGTLIASAPADETASASPEGMVIVSETFA